ncbi:hypothetical protein [Clostridium tyrobutyricum]|uniref:hypothetical protein n=1 Tax=Clostridium tyrobutyricum TaxID=1519 RepID=UPI002B21DD0B|nr:hypothetical protein [Clostridium tyrobutyricum]MEA5009156.1 hypothetical protein [Clostridium tyrobutyricum]
MGTSSSYAGRKDKNNLLPDDYNNNDNNQEVPRIASWQSLKMEMSKYINGNGGSIRRIGGKYIKASGGSSALIATSTNGIRATTNIGNFFSEIKQEGVINTFRKFEIEYIGKDVNEILSSLVNFIAEGSDTKDEGIAREAATYALSQVYDFIEKGGMTIDILDSMPDELMNEVLCSYVENYIWGKMLNELEYNLEKYSDDPKESVKIEKEIKTYIENVVNIEFENSELKSTYLATDSISQSVEILYEKCYEVMEMIE